MNKETNVETVWGEEDILISASYPTLHDYSIFMIPDSKSGTEKGFIAGINDVSFDVFTTTDQYFGFQHTDCSLYDYVIDAEKSCSENDKNKCWAATASNLLYRAGWITSETKTEDKVFDVFRNNFLSGETRTGFITDGVDWFLTGHYQYSSSSMYDYCNSGTGNYFPVSVSDCSVYLSGETHSNGSYTILENAISALKQGKTFGLGTYSVHVSSGSVGHAITLQGYTYEPITIDTNQYQKITGIIIADSDDNWSASIYSENEPNVLVVVPVHFILGDIFLDWRYRNLMSCGFSPSKIESSTILTPANYTMLSSHGSAVSSAATFFSKTLEAGLAMNVSSAGLAMETTVLLGGRQTVSFGGVTLSTMISSGGAQDILWGGMASNTKVFSGGVQIISSGGSALDTTVFSDGSIKVSSGGKAEQAVLELIPK